MVRLGPLLYRQETDRLGTFVKKDFSYIILYQCLLGDFSDDCFLEISISYYIYIIILLLTNTYNILMN